MPGTGKVRQQASGALLQTTLRKPATFSGTGLHSGQPVRMTVLPAPADHGIWFKRLDFAGGDPMIPAHWEAVVPSRLCTLIRNRAGAEVSTIEHLMAALAGCGVHNALVVIEGSEVPILDGSSVDFVDGLMRAGIHRLRAAVRALVIKKTVTVTEDLAWARLEPADNFEMDFHIDFEDRAIGRQDKRLKLTNGAFVRELSDSRTFCRQADVDAMRAAGLALGGTYENAVVVNGEQVLSPGGLRHADEAVRHKMLDAVGDLALAGPPLIGRYTGHRAGHALTNRLLRALFVDPDAWTITTCGTELAGRLNGVGVAREELPLSA